MERAKSGAGAFATLERRAMHGRTDVVLLISWKEANGEARKAEQKFLVVFWCWRAENEARTAEQNARASPKSRTLICSSRRQNSPK